MNNEKPTIDKLPPQVEQPLLSGLQKAKQQRADGDYFVKMHLKGGTVCPGSVKLIKLTDAG